LEWKNCLAGGSISKFYCLNLRNTSKIEYISFRIWVKVNLRTSSYVNDWVFIVSLS